PSYPPLANDLVNNVIRDKKKNIWILLFRDNILLKYNEQTKKLSSFNIYEMTGGYPSAINLDSKGRIWCAFAGGVIVFDGNGGTKIIRFPETNSSEWAISIGNVGDDVWISTHSNVWKVNGESLTATLLPLPQKGYTAIYQDKLTGKVLLGGVDEILEVDPLKLENAVELRSIKMVVNDSGEGILDLSELRRDDNGLTIPYGGKVTLVVSSLDYSPESISRYLYKLAKDRTDTVGGWVVMPEGANTITLSDLKMGEYRILVKNLGSPGSPIAVPLTVQRPVSLSWWAITLYVIIGLALIGGVIIYMRRRSARVIQEEERRKTVQMAERRLNFLTAISHDLKTPLSMIMGPVSLLKEKTEDADSRRSLETVYDNAVRLNNMIHRTLELHDLNEDDEWLLINSVFDAVEFTKVIFSRFQDNNLRKHFIFHASCNHLLIEADAVKFESIVTNLLSNACKYSEDGATITCCINQKGDLLELIVSDDGVGISDKDRPFVFKRMFRASNTAKSREGTGIGLYLIKKYLDKMGGTIELDSKEGEGTSFLVTLPIPQRSVTQSTGSADENRENLKKVLIVEDNEQIASFIRDMLNKEFTCIIADNGRAGLAIAQSFNPDVIILDEMMPIMNGMEMAQRLKQISRLATVPVIMLTAKSDNRTENESVRAGIDIFMSKPFEPTVLLGRIKQLLKKREDLKEDIRKDYRIRSMTAPKPVEAESIPEKQLAHIAKVIEENYSNLDLNVNFLCEKCDMSHKQLYRILKKYIGMSPLDYIQSVRLQKAAVLLKQHHFTVSEVCYMVGFKTPSYFSKCFQTQFGVNPSQYGALDSVDAGKQTDN
ncbi:MAG: response regulator, partial [Muribaculaceae bacterium]|nr:response regulator [Muribaculaceae bacterium]